MPSQLTASQIDRAYACPASFALPLVVLPSNFEANKGKAIHHFLENAVKKGRTVALAEVPIDAPWRHMCENIKVDEIISHAKSVECELSIAYNPLTSSSRVLGTSLGRNYNVQEDEIAGTVDLLVTKADGSVVVIDYKTGHVPIYVNSSGQLKFLGLAIARALNLSQISIAIIQFDEAGDFRRNEVLLTRETLGLVAKNINDTFTKVMVAREQVGKGQMPDVFVGEHCSYCPAFRSCPAHINLARGLISQHQDIASVIKEMTPKEAGVVWERLSYAKRILEEVEQGLKALADQEPIPLPDGDKEVARVDSTRETIIGRVAVDALYEQLGELAQDIIEPSVSKTTLESVIKKHSKTSQEANATINGVMSTLRQVGAIKETPIVSYRARAIKKSLKQ